MTDHHNSRRRATIASIAALVASLTLGGCQSPMYSGTPDDMSGSIAPAHSPDTYEPPAKVGGTDQQEAEQQIPQDDAKYEYRGGRDPITGKAEKQM
ncbi:Lipoprotein [Hyphomicrobium sp. 1Nfss2.1]